MKAPKPEPEVTIKHIEQLLGRIGQLPEDTVFPAPDGWDSPTALAEEDVRRFALEIYRGDQAAVERFLNRPHLMLEDRTPLAVVLEDPGGAERVCNLLGRAAYGGSV